VLATLSDKQVAHKLVDEIAPRFDDRPGGYTRIFKLVCARATRPRWLCWNWWSDAALLGSSRV